MLHNTVKIFKVVLNLPLLLCRLSTTFCLICGSFLVQPYKARKTFAFRLCNGSDSPLLLQYVQTHYSGVDCWALFTEISIYLGWSL